MDQYKNKIALVTGGSSGIGLALAKKWIEEFGGKIWFETKVNSGTTFYIELPLSKWC